MVLVSEYPSEDRGALGVVTLEDVIEELIGEEIIDESDVFVDVHKAIRRMTPAPKSRVPKGRIVEDPPFNTVPQGELVDVGSEAQSPSKKDVSNLRRRSLEAPQPRFQLRRQSTGRDSDWKGGLVTQRGATDEIREHLKHLGPSNLASRPRQTRYQNVKIKRGGMSPSRPGQIEFDSSQSNSEAASAQHAAVGLAGGIGAGLLQSAGMDASDGVHAVKLGYGTIAPMIDRAKDTPTPPKLKDNPQLSVPEPVSEEQDDQPRSPPSRQGSTHDSIRSGSSQSAKALKPGNYVHPGPARSGSITEKVIDVNGIRKVVLHTTSSSEGEAQTSPPTTGKAEPPIQQSAKADDKVSNTGTSSNAAKKKRRRKKRANQNKSTDGGSNEQQPLLS